MIKLMSKVGKYGLIILTPPIKPEFMSKYKKTDMCFGGFGINQTC